MTENDDPKHIQREGDTVKKLLSKTRWGGKLFPKEEGLVRDNAEENQLSDDVVDFLRPSTDRAARIPARRPVGPKLDLQAVQAWAEEEVVRQNQNIQPGVRRSSGGQHARRTFQKLKVTFATAAPEIIGYGGDEAETPPAEVIDFRKQRQAPKVQRLRPAAGEEVYECRGSAATTTSDAGHSKAPYKGSKQFPPSLEGVLQAPPPTLNTSAQSTPVDQSPQLYGKSGEKLRHPKFKRPSTVVARTDNISSGRRTQDREVVPGGEDLGNTTPSSGGQMQASTSRPPPTYSPESPHMSQRSRLTISFKPDSASSAPVVVDLPRHMLEEPFKARRHELSSSPDIETERNTSFNQHIVDKPLIKTDVPTLPMPKVSMNFHPSTSGHSLSFPTSDAVISLNSGSPHPIPFVTRSHDDSPPPLQFSHDDQPSFKPSVNFPESYANPPQQNKFGLSSALSSSTQARNRQTSPCSATSHKLSTLAAISQAVSSGRNISSTAPPLQPRALALASEEALAERESLVSPSRQPPFSAQPVCRRFPNNITQSRIGYTGSTSYFPLSNSSVIETKSRPESTTAQESCARAFPELGSVDSGEAQQSSLEDNGDVTWLDFVDRIIHLKQVFQLTAEFEGPASGLSGSDLARAGLWWFVKARSGFEALVQGEPRSVGSRRHSREEVDEILQPHVDLAKAWWISTEILQAPPNENAEEDETASAVELRSTTEALLSAMKALVISISRNHLLPPHGSLAQGCNTSIWIKYPAFAPDIWSCVSAKAASKINLMNSGARSLDPLHEVPLGDTKDNFCYGRTFVIAFMATEYPNARQIPLPCVLTILRGHLDWSMKLRITSQNGLVSICVSSDKQYGPTWDDVQWKSKSQSIYIKLPRGFALRVQFDQADFQMLQETYNYNRKVEGNLHPAPDEKTVYEVTLKDVGYQGSRRSPTVPVQRLRRCRLRIFEKFATTVEAAGQRCFHRGYRLCVATSTKSKHLSSLCHIFGRETPTVFELVSDSSHEALPVLKLSFKQQDQFCTLQLVFTCMDDLQRTYHTLNGMSVESDETSSAVLQLKGLSIEPLTRTGGFVHCCHDPIKAFQWQSIEVINEDPHNADNRAKTVLAERLRVAMRHTVGSITDRINLGPGELRFRLPVGSDADLIVLRALQEDMTVSINASAGREGIPDALERLLLTVIPSSTIRTFSFHTLPDLHVFEEAITGFHVIYDGTATAFTVSRRRMVVPIHKTWTAGATRIQIVQQSTITQLLAFFSDFSHGQCMSFQIKSHDVFEKVEKSGRYWVKLVDAKFPLPCRGEGEESKAAEPGSDDAQAAGRGTQNAQAAGWVCLDSPEWPSECDDIMIGFESEAERDVFVEALPAPAQAHRALTFRRRI